MFAYSGLGFGTGSKAGLERLEGGDLALGLEKQCVRYGNMEEGR